MTGRTTGSIPATCGVCGAVLAARSRACAICGAPAPRTSTGAYSATQDFDLWAFAFGRLRDATHGEYEIQREVGRGGMAAVYLARDLTLSRSVAIKLMSPRLMADPELMARFRQEAVTVANLSHPHIVTIYAVRQVEELHFFTMQFVEGRSLDHVVQAAGALPIDVVRALLFMIGSALGYAHRHGVVHRDVKPGNVLVDGDGNAIVTDFGIAKVTQEVGSTVHLTQTGTFIGTPTYVSPEQCYALPVSPASDQYSLGVVAYELLTGHPPFSGSSFTVMQAHTERAAPPLREARPDCPPALEAAVLRMLEKDPERRWPSMQHALAALEAVPLPEHDPIREQLARLALPPSMARSEEILAQRVVATTDEPVPYVASVDILAAPSEVQVGDSLALGAAPRNAAGATMPSARVTWSSSAPAVASVDEATGLVHALAEGAAEISATASGVRGAVQLRVVARRAAQLRIADPARPIHVGDRVQLAVTQTDRPGEAVHDAVRWSTLTPLLAQLAADGTLAALAEGTAVVVAEVNGERITAQLGISAAPVASLRVGAVPASLEVGAQLSVGVTPLDEAGRPLMGRAMTWLSSDHALATVSASGVVSALTPGTVLLICNCEDQTAAIELEVVPLRVAAVRIERPPQASVGEPFTLEVEALSAHGRRVPAELEFQSTAPDVAQVDDRGVVTPIAPGEVTIVVRTGDARGMVTFVVEARNARRARPRIGRRQLGRNVLAGGLTFGVVALAMAAWQLGGRGEDTVGGDVEQRVPTPAVTQQAAVPAPAAPVTPDSTGPTAAAVVSARIRRQGVMTVGETRRLRLEVDSTSGAAVPTATWLSRAPSVLEVDAATGRATARAEGSVMVVATYAGGADSLAITVSAPQVARVELESTSVALLVGDSARVRAAALDRNGTPVPGRAPVWRSEDAAAVSVTPEGLVRALTAGTVYLTARAGSVTATLRVDVRESAVVIAKRLDARADELATAVARRDTARVRALFASDDAGGLALIDLLTKRDVRLRESSRSAHALTDSTAELTVRIESTRSQLLRDRKSTAVYRVRLRLMDGSWQPVPVATAAGFK